MMSKRNWVFAGMALVVVWTMVSVAVPADATTQVAVPSRTVNRQHLMVSPAQRLGLQRSRAESTFLLQAFAASGATPTGYLIHDWTQVNQKFVSLTQLQSWAGNISHDLAIFSSHTVTRRTKGENFYEIYGAGPGNTQVRVVLSSFQFGKTQDTGATISTLQSVGGQAETLLVISLQQNDAHLAGLTTDWERMDQALTQANWVPQISACIEGFRNDRMGDGQRVRWANLVLQNVHAVRVEGLTLHNVTSISGYSQGQDIAILANGHPINVQVAAYYNAYRHHTNVLVGTPVITIPY